MLSFIFNKAIFIKNYLAKYNNNNRGKIRISLITCFCNCACIKYAWRLWKGRLCNLNTNFVSTVISRLLSMFKLVVLWGAAEALWKLCKTFYLEAILFLCIMRSGYFSSFVFYFKNICMKTRSLFLTSTSALATCRLWEVIILCDIISISMATHWAYFFFFNIMKSYRLSAAAKCLSQNRYIITSQFSAPTACGLFIAKHQSFSLLHLIPLKSMRLSILIIHNLVKE